MKIEKCNILITGGAGFIGSNLANYLGGSNKVIIIDNLSMGKKENLDFSKNIELVVGDITDVDFLNSFFENRQFDYVFHLAAIASVADSIERPKETHQVNFDAVLDLLETIRHSQNNLNRFIFASSASVYGDSEDLIKGENSSIKTLTPYAVDKFAAERYTLNSFNLYDFPASAVRFFNVYGPNQNPASPYSGVLSIIVSKYDAQSQQEEKKDNDEFIIFGDGLQTRDFVYVDDVIQALEIVATSNESLGEVYNVGTGEETALIEIIEILNNEFKINLRKRYSQPRTGDIRRSVSSIDKIEKLGFTVNFDIKKGLRKYLDIENKR